MFLLKEDAWLGLSLLPPTAAPRLPTATKSVKSGENLLSVFAVFDGHGGHECSAFASDRFPSYLHAELEQVKDIGTPAYTGELDLGSTPDSLPANMISNVLQRALLELDWKFRQCMPQHSRFV